MHHEKLEKNKSPEFLSNPEWMRKLTGSVVTDTGKPYPEGKLKRVFHGTTTPFEFFSTDKVREMGLHIGSIPVANAMAISHEEVPTDTARVYPLYLDIKNPLWMKDRFSWDVETRANRRLMACAIARDKLESSVDVDLLEEMTGHVVYAYKLPPESIAHELEKRYGEDGGKFFELFTEINKDVEQVPSREELLKFFDKYGYDGVAYFNQIEAQRIKEVTVGEDVSYIALRPEQVLSAIDGEPVWRE